MATRAEVEAVRGSVKFLAEQHHRLNDEIDDLARRVDAVARRVERHELRLLRLEQRILP
ncbi:MAG: hypothetical protein ACRD26_02915 [Vicinamibacterales bacterium]